VTRDDLDAVEVAARALEAERFGSRVPEYQPSAVERDAGMRRRQLLEETHIDQALVGAGGSA
jgi:hypothetical protein